MGRVGPKLLLLLTWLLFLGLGGWVWTSLRKHGPQRRAARAWKALRSFARHLADPRLEAGPEASPRAPSLAGTRVRGRFEGREVHLEVVEADLGGYRLQLGVEVDPDVRLEVRAPRLLERLLGPRGRRVPGTREAALLARGSGRRAEEVFEHGGAELGTALEELLGYCVDERLVAERGWLYLETVLPRLSARWLAWLCRRLARVARFYERRPVVVRARRRYAWTGGHTATRCPYCRDALAPEDEGLVACGECDTLHHTECFAAHGACSIYACGGVRSQPVSA
ncbi:MAG: hypothetical protein D6731_02270 [Planctomycetota bacterium]|nr:MAG: hypothetical protein D6731_02270 [Planctomycetota bacterium]